MVLVGIKTLILVDFSPCPNGYTFSSDFSACYKLHTEPKFPWDDARRVCKADGGDLASVKGNKENSFIKGSSNSFLSVFMNCNILISISRCFRVYLASCGFSNPINLRS